MTPSFLFFRRASGGSPCLRRASFQEGISRARMKECICSSASTPLTCAEALFMRIKKKKKNKGLKRGVWWAARRGG